MDSVASSSHTTFSLYFLSSFLSYLLCFLACVRNLCRMPSYLGGTSESSIYITSCLLKSLQLVSFWKQHRCLLYEIQFLLCISVVGGKNNDFWSRWSHFCWKICIVVKKCSVFMKLTWIQACCLGSLFEGSVRNKSPQDKTISTLFPRLNTVKLM